MDFGDLIIFTLKLFRENPDVLEKYRKLFKYILVDEFSGYQLYPECFG
jgi:DNA helicase-2/ATP-dependent DNA helicase PcrA